jgi:hypothetical protein
LISIYGRAAHLKEDRLGRAVYAFFTKVQLGGSDAKCDSTSTIPQAKALATHFKRVLSLGHACVPARV